MNIKGARQTPFHLDIEQEFEVRYWARYLGMTPSQLRHAARVASRDILEIARLVGREIR